MSFHAKKVLINACSNWGALFTNILLAFVMSPVIIRSLGDANYGIWSLMMSISGYLALLDLGIGSAVTRYVSKSVGSGDRLYVSRIFNAALLMFFVVGVGILCLSPLLGWCTAALIKQQAGSRGEIIHLVMLICADVAIFLVGAAFRGCYQGAQRYDLVNAVSIALAFVKAGLSYWVLRSGYGLISLAYVILIVESLALSGYVLLLRFTGLQVSYDLKLVQREDIGTLITYSKFTFVNMMANQVIYYSDSFVIGAFISTAAITYYSIGWSLVEYLKKFCVSFSRVFVPVFSEMEVSSDSDGMRNMMISGSKAALFLSLPLCLALLLLGQEFVTLWLGKEYAARAYTVLVILLVPQFFEIPQQINCSLLFGIGKHSYLSYANTVSGACNLILSILLALKFGVVGVAVGTALPQMLLNAAVIPRYVCRQTGLGIWTYYYRVYGKVLLPAATFALLLAWTRSRFPAGSYLMLAAEAAAAFCAYVVVFYFVGLRQEELRYVNAGMQKVGRKVVQYVA